MKSKKITEIHTKAERTLGLRPGTTTNIRGGRAAAPGNRPNFGGMMPRMPSMTEQDNGK